MLHYKNQVNHFFNGLGSLGLYYMCLLTIQLHLQNVGGGNPPDHTKEQTENLEVQYCL